MELSTVLFAYQREPFLFDENYFSKKKRRTKFARLEQEGR